MKLLLDTHCFIWLTTQPTRLSKPARAAILDTGTDLYLSIASLWEMQIKMGLGKLQLAFPLAQALRREAESNALRLLPVEPEHVYAIEKLPDAHSDPFDRMLAAQSVIEQMPLVSADPQLARYPVKIVW